jgi:streptogramin lyase
VRNVRTAWWGAAAGAALCLALACGGAPASALPLKLFSSPFPSCTPRGLVYGPRESIWFLLRGCEEIRHGELASFSGIGRLPVDGRSALLVRRLAKTPESMTVGPEGDLWFTEDASNDEGEGDPAIARLTASGQLTEFPTPVEPSQVFPKEAPLHEQPGQISAGPEGDLWFTSEGFGTEVLSRITSAGALSQFPPGQEEFGNGKTQPKLDEVVRWFASAGNDSLWVANGFGTLGRVEPGGAIRPVPVAEGPNLGVDEGALSDPIVGTADGGVWLVEKQGFAHVSESGVVVGRVPRVERETGFGGSLATTADGVLWVRELGAGDAVKRITGAGQFGQISFCNAKETPALMTVGPEGDIWFSSREGNFGQLDVQQVTGELERDGTQVRVCAATATPRYLRASIACSSLNLLRVKLVHVSIWSTCDYRATVTFAGAPGRVVGVGRFLARAYREPGALKVSLRPVVRALLRRRGRLSLRLTLWSGARVAASRVVVLRR